MATTGPGGTFKGMRREGGGDTISTLGGMDTPDFLDAMKRWFNATHPFQLLVAVWTSSWLIVTIVHVSCGTQNVQRSPLANTSYQYRLPNTISALLLYLLVLRTRIKNKKKAIQLNKKYNKVKHIRGISTISFSFPLMSFNKLIGPPF